MQNIAPHMAPRAEDRVAIRPLGASDRGALAEAFSHLSAETRRRRFGEVVNQLSERDLDRLTDIDHHDHEALAALDRNTGRIVGVARYIALPNDPGAAEVAIEVDDDWQGRGIGRRLMSELVERAGDEGIDRLVAYVSSDNLPVLSWIARSGGSVHGSAGDAAVYSIPLDHDQQERLAA
jgi:RimJ/RimL family protein N-acetyltransferase